MLTKFYIKIIFTTIDLKKCFGFLEIGLCGYTYGKSERRMDTNTILTVFGIMVTNLAVVITLHLYSVTTTNALVKSIADEMKDFHGRLCAIEERSKIRIHTDK